MHGVRGGPAGPLGLTRTGPHPTAHGVGGRGGGRRSRPSRANTASWRDRRRNHPRFPARCGNGGNRFAGASRGAFLLGERLRRGCCRCCWGWLLLLCAGELSGSVGNGGPVEDHSQATQAANPRRAQDGDEVHDRHGSALGEYVLPVFGYLVRAEGFLVQAEDAARPPPLVLVTRNSGEGSTLSASNRMELVDDVSAAPGRRHHIRLARH